MTLHAGALKREQPPFHAEHIGSLLRPAALLQEQLGLRFATDGENHARTGHGRAYENARHGHAGERHGGLCAVHEGRS